MLSSSNYLLLGCILVILCYTPNTLSLPSVTPSPSPSPQVGACCSYFKPCTATYGCSSTSEYTCDHTTDTLYQGATSTCASNCTFNSRCYAESRAAVNCDSLRNQNYRLQAAECESRLSTCYAAPYACWLAHGGNVNRWGYTTRLNNIVSEISGPQGNNLYDLRDTPIGSCVVRYLEFVVNETDTSTALVEIAANLTKPAYNRPWSKFGISFQVTIPGWHVGAVVLVLLQLANPPCTGFAVTTTEGPPSPRPIPSRDMLLDPFSDNFQSAQYAWGETGFTPEETETETKTTKDNEEDELKRQLVSRAFEEANNYMNREISIEESKRYVGDGSYFPYPPQP